jgi:hypothetical protein
MHVKGGRSSRTRKKLTNGMLISVMIVVVVATSWKREVIARALGPVVVKWVDSFPRKCDQNDDDDDSGDVEDDEKVFLVTGCLRGDLHLSH